jgi:hypothetical protein
MFDRRSRSTLLRFAMALVVASSVAALSAQAAKKPAAQAPKPATPAAKAPLPVAPAAKAVVQQVVKPPVAQAWLDVATFSGFGIPNMSQMMQGEGGMGAAMGAMFGGGKKNENSNEFLRTQTGLEGRWLDVTLRTSRNPELAEATQAVPQGFGLAPSLKLQTPPKAEPVKHDDDEPEKFEYERPKGKLYLYWGCGAEVREGQPRVLDLATATPQELGQFFQARRATQRGAHSAAGRPVWPSRDDRRLVPGSASLVGEHAFTGQGVPESFRFTIPAMQDFMPEIALKQQEQGGAHVLNWQALETARAYFVSAMGARGGGETEMVLWTSSEVADSGFGLLDYQTNASVDKWLEEKVLLTPQTTTCTVPKGIFGEEGGAMLRMIAYGNELNLVDPPRPADPKVAWEPVWSTKIRVKSVANAMLGLDMSEMRESSGSARKPSGTSPEAAGAKQEPQKPKKKGLGGILGGVIKP